MLLQRGGAAAVFRAIIQPEIRNDHAQAFAGDLIDHALACRRENGFVRQYSVLLRITRETGEATKRKIQLAQRGFRIALEANAVAVIVGEFPEKFDDLRFADLICVSHNVLQLNNPLRERHASTLYGAFSDSDPKTVMLCVRLARFARAAYACAHFG